MVLNDIINEAATGPPFNGNGHSSPPTVSALVGGRSAHIRPSISSLSKGDNNKIDNNQFRKTGSRRQRRMKTYDDDEEGPKLKERITNGFYKGIDIFCVWDCCWAYVRLSEVLKLFVCVLDKKHNHKVL